MRSFKTYFLQGLLARLRVGDRGQNFFHRGLTGHEDLEAYFFHGVYGSLICNDNHLCAHWAGLPRHSARAGWRLQVRPMGGRGGLLILWIEDSQGKTSAHT